MTELIIVIAILAIITNNAHTAHGKHHGHVKKQSLIPFPRVGRGAMISNDNMLIPYEDYYNDLDADEFLPYEGGLKRQSLIPFPRVGRRSAGFPWLTPVIVGSDSYEGSSSATDSDDDSSNESKPVVAKRKDSKNYLWYGPRLGKRSKRSTDSQMDAERRKNLYDLIEKLAQHSALSIQDDQLQKRAPFAPRLGKRDGVDLTNSDLWLNQGDSPMGIFDRDQRAPFAPRLGKRGDEERIFRQQRAPFAPRLGRSGSDSNAFDRSQRAPFAPRLGRSVSESNA